MYCERNNVAYCDIRILFLHMSQCGLFCSYSLYIYILFVYNCRLVIVYNTRLSINLFLLPQIVIYTIKFDTPVVCIYDIACICSFLYDYYDIVSKYMDFVDPIVSDR